MQFSRLGFRQICSHCFFLLFEVDVIERSRRPGKRKPRDSRNFEEEPSTTTTSTPTTSFENKDNSAGPSTICRHNDFFRPTSRLTTSQSCTAGFDENLGRRKRRLPDVVRRSISISFTTKSSRQRQRQSSVTKCHQLRTDSEATAFPQR